VWYPPDPYEPTSELYRIMPPRRPADDDVLVDLTVPRQRWWHELATRGRPVSRRVAGWATAALAVVIGSLIYGWLSGLELL
jgi:hypothetical protein